MIYLKSEKRYMGNCIGLIKYCRSTKLSYFISFFEIYGGRLFDLLNNRNQLQLLEDANQKIQIQGLTEREVNTPDDMTKQMDYANGVRTTCATTSNDTSSRSHAICQIVIRTKDSKQVGKLSLVDLAVKLLFRFIYKGV